MENRASRSRGFIVSDLTACYVVALPSRTLDHASTLQMTFTARFAAAIR